MIDDEQIWRAFEESNRARGVRQPGAAIVAPRKALGWRQRLCKLLCWPCTFDS